MEITYFFNQNPELKDLLSSTFNEFQKVDKVSITFSDAFPPLWREIAGKNIKKEIPIDSFLGTYDLEKREIIIYLQAIHWTTNVLSSSSNQHLGSFSSLLKIVILHELGHFWFHNVKIDEEYPIGFISEEVNEWIAQTFTYLIIKNDNVLLNIFDELQKIQPEHYKLHDKLRETNILKEIVKILRKNKIQNVTWSELKERTDIYLWLYASRIDI